MLDAQERAQQVDAQHALEVGNLERRNRGHAADDTGVGEISVEPPMGSDALFCEPLHRGFVGGIPLDVHHRVTRSRKLFVHAAQAHLHRCRKHQASPCLGKAASTRTTDATGGAGHDDGLSAQHQKRPPNVTPLLSMSELDGDLWHAFRLAFAAARQEHHRGYAQRRRRQRPDVTPLSVA